MKLCLINGPNLNLVGQREPDQYGDQSFDEFIPQLKADFPSIEISYFQSNIEGELITAIQVAGADHDGIILNAGAYTHTSIGIADAIRAIKAPVIEVHLSNVASRETFRHESYLTPVCKGLIMGFGMESYRLALLYFCLKFQV
ncbi:MAG: type II 3-dehydroquinate dehydratase [Flavobacterium sp. BFFFF2]|nr:MAG: type II 3-dehydroquinate dehydratase [Flavobacterium sp. BFFFF2]